MRRQEGFSMIDSAKFHEKILCPVWSTKRLPRFGNIANRPSSTLAYPRLCALLTTKFENGLPLRSDNFRNTCIRAAKAHAPRHFSSIDRQTVP